jgi:hypothetical protein
MEHHVRPGVIIMAASLLATALLSGCASTSPIRVTAFQNAFVPQPPMRYTLQAPQLVSDTERDGIAQAFAEAGLQPVSAGQRADVSVSLGYATREQSVGVAAACESATGAGAGAAAAVGSGADTAAAGTCGVPGQHQPWFGAKRYLHVLTLALTQTGDGTLRYRVSANNTDQNPDGATALPILLTCALHPFPRAAADNEVALTCRPER